MSQPASLEFEVSILPRTPELQRRMDALGLRKSSIKCAPPSHPRHPALTAHMPRSADRFKRSKLHKKFLCEVVAHLAKKYERLETEVRPPAQVPVLTCAE